MKKIICESCGTIFKFETVKEAKNCPVCGVSFDEEEDIIPPPKKGKTTYYYYKGACGTLTTTLYEDENPLYTFEAVDMKDAERQLKEVLPNSPLLRDNSVPETRCPYCRSKEIQIVPKKFSLLTGIAANSYNRVCVHCKRKF